MTTIMAQILNANLAMVQKLGTAGKSQKRIERIYRLKGWRHVDYAVSKAAGISVSTVAQYVVLFGAWVTAHL